MTDQASFAAPASLGKPGMPHSMEAEQAVLGGVLLDNGVWDSVFDVLSPSDFFHPDHALVFSAMKLLADRSTPIDTVTVKEALEVLNGPVESSLLSYVSDLSRNTVSNANIKVYSQQIRERSIFRRIIATCDDVSAKAHRPEGMSCDEVLEHAERQILSIGEVRPQSGGAVPLSSLLSKSLRSIDERSQSGNQLLGESTGYPELDAMTLGLQATDLIVVAGRPSMGKTTFAMNLVEHVGKSQPKVVLVFSLEMPGESLMLRMLSSCASIDQNRMRSGRLEEDDWPKLVGAVNDLKKANIFIDDTSGISPSEMRSRTRRLRRQHGEIALIMVDYLQLMEVPSLKNNRTAEVSEVSRSLKALAKEFDCPVIALSQLNRSLEKREDKRPVNADLRESGAIEQDADVIMFVYRDEVYHPDSEDKGVAEIIIGKARNHDIGTVKLSFVGKYTRFESLAGSK